MTINPSMLPRGHYFRPTNEELLGYYLLNKIVGEHVPLIVLPVIDLYIQEPDQIWQQCGGVDGQDIYFFTTLKKKKSRIIRKVGSNGGTWSGENKAQQVFTSKTKLLMGSIKRFHYENPKVLKSATDNDYSWIMHEYTLHPTIVPKGLAHDSYVLCMIRKRMVKTDKIGASGKRQAPCNWPPTRTQMEVHDQTHKRIRLEEEIIGSEKEFFIDEIDFSNEFCLDVEPLAEEKIEELFHGNDSEPLQLEQNMLTINNQPDEIKILDQNCVDVGPAKECSTIEKQSCDLDFTNDSTIVAKETEMEIERRNNMGLSNVENGLSYDNSDFSNEFCIAIESLTKEEIEELLHENDLEPLQPEQNILMINNKRDEIKLLDQNCVDVGPANECSTIEMQSCDLDFTNDSIIVAKETEMEIELRNNMGLSNVENGLSYDNSDFSNEFCIAIESLTKDEIEELLHENDSEPLQPEQNISMINNKLDEIKLLDQNCIDVGSTNECSTIEMQPWSLDFSNDSTIIAKGTEIEIEPRNNMGLSNVENGLSYDNSDFSNEFCIVLESLSEEEIEELLQENDSEPLQPEQNIVMIKNQTDEMRLLNQNCRYVGSTNECSTREMHAIM